MCSSYESTGNLRKSVEAGFKALSVYGIDIPMHPSDEMAIKMKDDVLTAQQTKTKRFLILAL